MLGSNFGNFRRESRGVQGLAAAVRWARRRASMRIVLDGLLWRCRVRRNVAVLTGELFGPAPPGGGRAKSLGTCAFSGKWPVSDVD